MKKKIIFITGSTDGIGKLAAIQLAKDGHTICLHGRNPEKLALVVSEVKEHSNKEDVRGFVADFSDLEAVRQMAQEINSELSRIDVLINNAGVFKSAIAHNKDGLDLRFVVNYFAPYILTNALIPVLQKDDEARIINVSSAAQASVSLDAMSGKAQLSIRDGYAQSKLALTMWSFYLAKMLKDITVIAVNPGSLLDTKMVKEAFGTHWSSADKGATILYELAVSDVHKGVTGKYFDNDKGTFGDAHTDAYNEAEIDKLINTTKTILNI